MAAPVLQFKRGLLANLPGLRAGEPGFTTDSYDLYVGIDSSTNNNKFFGSHRYWSKETTSKGSGINLVEGTTNGTSFITLKAPDSLAGITTYTFPATATADYYLKTAADGTLSWAQISQNSFSGIVTFTDTTDNTLGNADTGAVQIDGGLGVNKNVTVGGNLNVQGYSEFVGVATFRGGTINLGDSTGDDINVGGEFISGLFPNTTATYDLGDGTRQWRHGNFSGIVTASTGAVFDGVQIGINGANVIDTVSGNLTLNSAGGQTIIDDLVTIQNNLTVNGNVTVGGTTVTLRGTDVFIENKDIILGYTTSVSPDDDTANHAGVAIASTVGTPLSSFAASGINTLPDTYKQLMWFKSGTLGFSTDAFAFNYGVAIGTTTMANGVRLAVGTGVTVGDTSVSATNFYGNASSATQVKTVNASDTNANYYVTFVDSNNGSATNETVYTDDGIYYNPGTNTLTTQNATFTGNVEVQGTLTATVTGTISTATRATTVDTTSTGTNTNYHLVFTDNATSTNGATMRVDAGIYYNPSSNNLFATQFIGDVSAGTIKAADATTAMTLANTTGNVTFGGDIQINGNDIKASDGNTNITLTSNTLTTFAGDIKVSGNDIQASDGTTALTLSATTGNVKTGGDLIAGSGYLASANGTRAMYMYDTSGDVSFQGKVVANNFRSSSNASNTLTFNDLDAVFARHLIITGVTTTSQLTIGTGVGVTQFSGSVSTGTSTSSVPTSSAVINYVGTQIAAVDLTTGIAGDTGTGTVSTSQTLTVAGTAGEIETAASGQTITVGLPDTVIVGTALSTPTLKTATIQHRNGTQAATIDTSGNITASQNLTVSGNLYVNGSTTQVNTSSMTVEDRTIELGLVDGSAPSSATTWDLGVLFNYNSSGAKKSGVVWEHADGRFKFASQLTDGGGTDNDSPQITFTAYAPIEVGSLWVNDCAGQSQVINCSGTTRTLENITIDAGTF